MGLVWRLGFVVGFKAWEGGWKGRPDLSFVGCPLSGIESATSGIESIQSPVRGASRLRGGLAQGGPKGRLEVTQSRHEVDDVGVFSLGIFVFFRFFVFVLRLLPV